MYVSDMFTVHTYLTTVERTLLRRGYNAVTSEITEGYGDDNSYPLHVKLHVDAGKRARVDAVSYTHLTLPTNREV